MVHSEFIASRITRKRQIYCRFLYANIQCPALQTQLNILFMIFLFIRSIDIVCLHFFLCVCSCRTIVMSRLLMTRLLPRNIQEVLHCGKIHALNSIWKWVFFMRLCAISIEWHRNYLLRLHTPFYCFIIMIIEIFPSLSPFYEHWWLPAVGLVWWCEFVCSCKNRFLFRNEYVSKCSSCKRKNQNHKYKQSENSITEMKYAKEMKLWLDARQMCISAFCFTSFLHAFFYMHVPFIRFLRFFFTFLWLLLLRLLFDEFISMFNDTNRA